MSFEFSDLSMRHIEPSTMSMFVTALLRLLTIFSTALQHSNNALRILL
jgi:hypothetical protein